MPILQRLNYALLWFLLLSAATWGTAALVVVAPQLAAGSPEPQRELLLRALQQLANYRHALWAIPLLLTLAGALTGLLPGTGRGASDDGLVALPPPGARFPSVLECFGLLVLVLLAQVVLATLWGAAFELAGVRNYQPDTDVLTAIGVLSLLIAAGYAMHRLGPAWRGLLASRRVPALLLAALPLVVLGTSILGSELDNLLRRFFAEAPAADTTQAAAAPEVFGVFSLVCLLALGPLLEEFIFRGVILKGLLGFRGAWHAIGLSALLWALPQASPTQLVPLFCLGLVLGWAYWATRSLWLCVGLHVFSNLILVSIVQHWLPLDIPGYTNTGALQYQPVWFDLLGAALLLAGVYLCGRTALPRAPD